MAFLNETDRYEPGIRQFEITDPLQGGENGVDNIPTRQLANRTRFLKNQFFDYLAGYTFTDEARVASTANVDFLTGGELEIDGVQTEIDDVVLLKNQTDATQNGLYVVKSSTWERLNPYVDDTVNAFDKKLVPVKEGTNNAGKIYMVRKLNLYTLGEDSIEFFETLFSFTGGAGKLVIYNPDGKISGAETKNLINVEVAVADWEADATYSDYGYKAEIDAPGITSDFSPDVRFAYDEISSGIFGPIADTDTDKVIIYASEVPESAITIPVIICTNMSA